MGAVRGYNNDCRDCYYYRGNYHFAFVGDDGRDYFKCAKCSDRSRVFSDRYGYTCSNLREIYDVEQSYVLPPCLATFRGSREGY